MKKTQIKIKNRFAFLTMVAALAVIGLQSFRTTNETLAASQEECSTAICSGGANFCCQTTSGNILFKK